MRFERKRTLARSKITREPEDYLHKISVETARTISAGTSKTWLLLDGVKHQVGPSAVC
jgi:hypothetical protein